MNLFKNSIPVNQKSYLAVVSTLFAIFFLIIGCAANTTVKKSSTQLYCNSADFSEQLVVVAEYHDMTTGDKISMLLSKRNLPAIVAGSETGVVITKVSQASIIRTIIDDAVKHDGLNAVIVNNLSPPIRSEMLNK